MTRPLLAALIMLISGHSGPTPRMAFWANTFFGIRDGMVPDSSPMLSIDFLLPYFSRKDRYLFDARRAGARPLHFLTARVGIPAER
jgi:hypothetical protein